MFHVGKLAVWQVEFPIQPEEFCSSSLNFLKDILSDREFLVGSRASVSMFPGPRALSDDEVCLLMANGLPMV